MTICSLPKTSNNVKFTVSQEGKAINFTLMRYNTLMFASINTDDSNVSGVRCIADTWLFPPGSLKDIRGCFRFETIDGRYPIFEDFGTSCCLCYYSESEYNEIKSNGK